MRFVQLRRYAILFALFIYFTAQAQLTFPQTDDMYYRDGQATLERMLNLEPNLNQAKNVIFFISDGMDPTIANVTRIYEGQLRGNPGEENFLSFERFPYIAVSKTYSTNAQTPDSAPTATAMMTGVKTKNDIIGLNDNALVADCSTHAGNEVMTVMELAETAGLATGIVSTARITHATPAAAYAHSVARDWESDDGIPEEAKALGCKDIASQLIEFPYGDGLDVAMGGGRQHFIPAELTDPEDADNTGNRTDGRNLPDEWVANGGEYVWNLEEFSSLDPMSDTPVLGLFNRSHMEYEHDRVLENGSAEAADEPSLSEMTAFAIQKLSQNPEGFVLQVESGRVDHAAHGGNAYRTITDNVEFAKAVQVALDLTNPEETLIIVSADHGHTMVLNGYAQRGNPILGLSRYVDDKGLPSDEISLAEDGKPYTTIMFMNGPGAADITGQPERPTVTEEQALDPDYLQQALVPMSSETHSGEDVLIYATGPQAHLFGGIVEQSYIFHVAEHALDLVQRARVAELLGTR
jgi:alkaline phosphatase